MKEKTLLDVDLGCNLKKIFRVVAIFIVIIFTIFAIYVVKNDIFKNQFVLISYIDKFGIMAPIIFVIIQVFQVVFPIIPGGISCIAGVFVFGAVVGFIYNYIGLIIGSIFSFFLSRIYGIKLIYFLFGYDKFSKYLKYVRTSKFDKIFFWCMFFPFFPDDLLCYVAGISNMKFKKFLFLILVSRPVSLIMYSIFIKLF